MNRRAFLLALPAVAAALSLEAKPPRAVHAGERGTGQATIERRASPRCAREHAYIETPSNLYHARVMCRFCGHIFSAGRWWRVRPLAHPGKLS